MIVRRSARGHRPTGTIPTYAPRTYTVEAVEDVPGCVVCKKPATHRIVGSEADGCAGLVGYYCPTHVLEQTTNTASLEVLIQTGAARVVVPASYERWRRENP